MKYYNEFKEIVNQIEKAVESICSLIEHYPISSIRCEFIDYWYPMIENDLIVIGIGYEEFNRYEDCKASVTIPLDILLDNQKAYKFVMEKHNDFVAKYKARYQMN